MAERPKPRIIFDTSAWLACIAGRVAELESLVEEHLVLTPDLCLVEIAGALSDQGVEPSRYLRFIEMLHEVVPSSPELAVAAATFRQETHAPARLVLVLAAREGLPAVFVEGDTLRRVTVPRHH